MNILKKCNAIIIGLGKIGMINGFDSKRIQPASHVAAIIKNSNINLIGVCDINIEFTDIFKKKYPEIKNVFNSLDDLLEKIVSTNIKIDIFSIATPENVHFKIIELLLKKNQNVSNKTIIFCEKPFTPDIASAKKIKDLNKNSNIHIVVNHIRRWSKIWKEIKNVISEIGEIKNGTYILSTTPENKNFSQIRDGIHIADVISWLNIAEKMTIKRLNVPYHVYEFHLWGEKGKIELIASDQILNFYKIKKSERFEGFQELHLKSTKSIDESYFENAYDEFVNFLNTKSLTLSTNIDDAIIAMETFERYVYDPRLDKK